MTHQAAISAGRRAAGARGAERRLGGRRRAPRTGSARPTRLEDLRGAAPTAPTCITFDHERIDPSTWRRSRPAACRSRRRPPAKLRRPGQAARPPRAAPRRLSRPAFAEARRSPTSRGSPGGTAGRSCQGRRAAATTATACRARRRRRAAARSSGSTPAACCCRAAPGRSSASSRVLVGRSRPGRDASHIRSSRRCSETRCAARSLAPGRRRSRARPDGRASWRCELADGDRRGRHPGRRAVRHADGLLVNEIALRPHNSGHYTIEGCATSQFEQHLRAVLGWPLGATELRAPAVGDGQRRRHRPRQRSCPRAARRARGARRARPPLRQTARLRAQARARDRVR